MWSTELEKEFQSLLELDADVWLVLDRRTPGADAIAARYPRHHLFDENQLLALPYPRLHGNGVIHHAHFVLLDFFQAHAGYHRYWVIEYDVRYSGSWRQFFRTVDSCDFDLITTHVRRYADEPRLHWWSTLEHPSKRIPREQFIRSFNVIYGMSRRALEFVRASLLDGWRGHPEVALPTLLSEGGFRVLDMGGSGEFTPEFLRNTMYTSWATSSGYLSPSGTLRFRPARLAAGDLPDRLYHPVKPSHLLESWQQRVKLTVLWVKELGEHIAFWSRTWTGRLHGKIKVSFRSTGDVDVNEFARRFAGGGHARASVALIPGRWTMSGIWW